VSCERDFNDYNDGGDDDDDDDDDNNNNNKYLSSSTRKQNICFLNYPGLGYAIKKGIFST